MDTLDAVIGQADIVVLMLPLTPQTKRIFDRERLGKMRPGAAFINVARGALVDQAAMTQLLQSGHIGAATLDVFEREPLPAEDALWQMPNVLITPAPRIRGDPVFLGQTDRSQYPARRGRRTAGQHHRAVARVLTGFRSSTHFATSRTGRPPTPSRSNADLRPASVRLTVRHRTPAGRVMNWKQLFALCRKAVGAWADDYAPSMGAAISYYTIFSRWPPCW